MTTKRKVADEPIRLDQEFFPNLLQTIQKIQLPYKTNINYNKETKQ